MTSHRDERTMSDKVRSDDGWECPHELRTVAMPGLATPADVLAQANARADQAEAHVKAMQETQSAELAELREPVHIVEGLPKYDEIVTKDHVVTVSVYDENNAHYRIECPSPPFADALAGILKYRQEMK